LPQEFKSDQKLANLPPECCFVATEPLESSAIGTIKRQKARGDLHIEVRFYEVSLGILVKTRRYRFSDCDHTAGRTPVDCRRISCTNRAAVDLQQTGLDGSSAAQPPQQAGKPQNEFALNRSSPVKIRSY
jgi:hypothetical protein